MSVDDPWDGERERLLLLAGFVSIAVSLLAGCGRKAEVVKPPPVDPEITAAIAETTAILDAPNADLDGLAALADRISHRWNTGGPYQDWLIARPRKDTFAEVFYVLHYAAGLFEGKRPPQRRLAAYPIQGLQGMPDTPDSLRKAWKSVNQCSGSVDGDAAREVCHALKVELWKRLKAKDPRVAEVCRKIEASAGGAVLLAILDRQEWCVVLSPEPASPSGAIPILDGKPRYTPEMVSEALGLAMRGVVADAFIGFGEAISWFPCAVMAKRTGQPELAEKRVTVKGRYRIRETPKVLRDSRSSWELKTLEVDLVVQFEVDGKPAGEPIELKGGTPKSVTYNEGREGPDFALLRETFRTAADQLGARLASPR